MSEADTVRDDEGESWGVTSPDDTDPAPERETTGATDTGATVMPGTVLITGCSSGVGQATAAAFREEGWTTYATARDVDQSGAIEEAS